MLRWRLLLGVLIIGALIGLCWLDHVIPLPGVVLLPVGLLFALLATGEIIQLCESAGLRPARAAVYAGNTLVIVAGWAAALWPCGVSGQPCTSGELLAATATATLLAAAAAVMLVFGAEMRCYEKPGGVTANAAAGTLAIVYVGLLLSFAVGLRLLWGIGALASLLIVVKMGDVGAYTIGRLVGRHKMAPVLSPGKTIEGAAGALLFGAVSAWAAFRWLVPALGEGSPSGLDFGWLLFGLAVAGAGMLGDLAESLIKRDVGQKDSSRWMPGFGGILDLLDSILFAAPVAYGFWALGLVGYGG